MEPIAAVLAVIVLMLAIPVGCGVLAGLIAKSKNYSFGYGFLLGFFFVLLGILVVGLHSRKPNPAIRRFRRGESWQRR